MSGGDGVAAKTPAGSAKTGAGAAPARSKILRQFELVERMPPGESGERLM